MFQDITPVLRNGTLFRRVTEAMAAPFADANVTYVLGIEARGFILGGPVATVLGAGFVPARKPGKLPWESLRESYDRTTARMRSRPIAIRGPTAREC